MSKEISTCSHGTGAESKALSAPDPSNATRDKGDLLSKVWWSRHCGLSLKDTAEKFGLCERTVQKYCKEYREDYKDRLATEQPASLIATEAARLEAIAFQVLEEAKSYPSARDKIAAQLCATRALKLRIDLFVRCGVLPTEPSKLLTASISLARPPADPEAKREDLRGPEMLKIFDKYCGKSPAKK